MFALKGIKHACEYKHEKPLTHLINLQLQSTIIRMSITEKLDTLW